jgi:hypothetical protein
LPWAAYRVGVAGDLSFEEDFSAPGLASIL